jgi:hypothetical protein
MAAVKAIESDSGEIWIMVRGTVIMYISPSGMIHTPNDIVAYADIPPPP